MSKQIVTVHFTIKPDHIQDFIKIFQEMAKLTLEEPGCLVYEASIKDNKVLLYEKYKSQEDFDFHASTSHFENFMKDIKDLVTEQTLNTYTLI